MGMRSLFTEHPASVGETYLQHLCSAGSFAARMFIGGTACLLHAFFPFAFRRTGSECITQLYERMVTHRARNAADDTTLVVNPPAARATRAGVAAR
jgi:hypothetical protein